MDRKGWRRPWERRAPQGRLRGAHTYPQVVKPAVPHVVGRVEEPRVLAGDSRGSRWAG